MKSVKPGRAPSAMGVWGAAVAVVIGIFWTVMASSMGAPAIFPVFGVLFIITGIITGLYNYRNATGKNRYSSYDITEDGEEIDPLNARFGNENADHAETPRQTAFCPTCGAPVESGDAFCRSCGKKL